MISERFCVERHVGSGGMGDVYSCQDRLTHGLAAVKVLRRIHDHSRFQREAAILSVLAHDAIVRYLHHGRTDTGTMYIAMEWLEGRDLAKSLERTTLSIADCISLARRVCAGLSVAHHHGFVHRDIKPSNVFLCDGAASAKLLDFGVAHWGVTTQTATRAGTLLGTVGYMAPEQASGATRPDPRDDLFSLGCVLFECITGRPAFLGENAVRVLESVLQAQPPDVRSLRSDTPKALSELVHCLLRKSRADRPVDVEAVLRLLQPLVTEVDPLPSQARSTVSFGIAVCARGVSVDSAKVVFPGAESIEHGAGVMAILRSQAQLGLVDLAAQALQGALAILTRAPDAAVWVVTIGHNIEGMSANELAGPVMAPSSNVQTQLAGTVAIDAVASALLRSRAQASGLPPQAHASLTPATPPVIASAERRAELSVMEAVLEECKADEVARTILVTAPSGFGKSQLCGELIRRAQSGERIEVLAATAKLPEQAQPLALLRAIHAPDAVERRADDELDAALSRLQSGAVTALVLCIDDAQWADLASMHMITDQLARLGERPWLVVGFARPGMSHELRALWQTSAVHAVTLRPLAARAAERWLQHALPKSQDRSTLITLAGGNPRLLSALAAVGDETTGPYFELASLLLAEQLLLSCPALDVFCALSMFTGRLRSAAVSALLDHNLDLPKRLTALCEHKLLVERVRAEAMLESTYEFAHPLLQSAAYRCLPAVERVRFRRRASAWLVRWAVADMQLYAGV
jgi:hypothetical protein